MIHDGRSNAGLLWGGLLIAMGAALLVQTTGVVTGLAGHWVGAAVLAAIGLLLLVPYLVERARWWVLIPAGALLSLAVGAAIAPFASGPVSGALVLFGLALTFAVVAVAPAPRRPRTWAWIPAVVLGILGAITLGVLAAASLWPVALILIGAYLVAAWAMRGRPRAG